MAKFTRTLAASNDDITRIARFNPVGKIYRWIRISGVTSTLQQLDDRTLEDIGINRGDIQSFAEELISKNRIQLPRACCLRPAAWACRSRRKRSDLRGISFPARPEMGVRPPMSSSNRRFRPLRLSSPPNKMIALCRDCLRSTP